MFSFNLKHFLSLNYKIHMETNIPYIHTYYIWNVCMRISDMYVGSSLRDAWVASCAWLIFYRTKCRSCFWSFRFLPAASIECEAVLGHVKRLPKKKVTKTMADSLFWAQIEHDLAPVTRPQHPGPSARISSRWSRQFTVTRPRDLLNQLAAVAPCTLTRGPTTCRCSTDYEECIHSILKSWVNRNNWLYMFTCHILLV